MVIKIDTREQNPLEFDFPYVTAVERTTLKVGDYSVRFEDNYSPPISFERKAIGDLFGTLGKSHKRFKRELLRAEGLGIKLIIIVEGSLGTVLKGYKHSTLSGISVVRQLLSLWVRYGVVPVFVESREKMGLYIYEYFSAVGRLKGKKSGK